MDDSPYKSRQAECACIYHLSMLRDPTALFQRLRQEDFYYKDTGDMYERMSTAFHKGRKLTGDATVIAACAPFMAEMGTNMSDWSTAAESVLVLSRRRCIADTIAKAQTKIDDFSANKADLEQSLYDLAERAMDDRAANDGEISATDAVNQSLAAIEHRLRGDELRLTTGIPLLDRHHRISPGNLITIAARPSVGKTALAITMLRGMLKRGLKVGFICMEMSPIEIANRFLSQESGIPYRDLEDGRFDPAELKVAVEEVHHWEASGQLYLSCGNTEFTAPQCRQLIKRWRHKHKVDLVVIDYLQRFGYSRRNQSAKERAEEAIEMAKGTAKDEGLAVIMLAQLNRDSQSQNRGPTRPRLHHIKDASRVEEESDAVFLLWRPDKEVDFIDGDTTWPNMQPTGQQNAVALSQGKMGVFCDKFRNGQTWKTYLTMHGPTMTYKGEPYDE